MAGSHRDRRDAGRLSGARRPFWRGNRGLGLAPEQPMAERDLLQLIRISSIKT